MSGLPQVVRAFSVETFPVLPPVLDWARRLQAIAQTGLTYASDSFDVERYQAIRRLAAEMATGQERGEAVDFAVEAFARDTGYTTPKVDVRAVVFRADGHLLLVRERSDGGWTLPGGWADVGLTPAENVVREVREESGYEVRATKLLAVYDRDRHPHPPMREAVYKLFLRCELVGGEAAAETSETTGVGFFAEDALPDLLSTARVTASQMHRFFEHQRQPDLPTKK